MHPVSKICLALLLAHFYSPGQAQTAILQPEQVFEGDIAELVIELDNKIPSLYALDLAGLETSFEVLNVQSRIARTLEANELFNRMQWKIDILPRRSGRLIIPPIKVGSVFTPELSLEVSRQTPALLARQDVFLEVEAQPQNPYAGQPARIITRLLHNTPVSDGSILEPGADGLEVYRSGRDSRYSINRNGKEFNVLERSIVLVAQSAGAINLSPASYRGLIQQEAVAAGAESTVPPRRIYRDSESLRLQVRHPPAEFSGNTWLPARQLNISRHWDAIAEDLKVGDSLGFKLTIEARGLPGETLPSDLVTGRSDKFRMYPDQAARSSKYQGDEVIGRLEQRFAVVVSQPGEITLPATILKWWDVSEDVERVARLESRTFRVANLPQKWSDPSDSSRAGLNPALATGPATVSLRNHWPWIALVAASITGMALLFRTPMRRQLSRKISSKLASRRNLRALRKACLANHPQNARREMLEWGRQRWPADNINSLKQIDARTGFPQLEEELTRLDRALYAKHASSWQGQLLWQVVVAAARRRPFEYDPGPNSLPGLYPRRDLSTR